MTLTEFVTERLKLRYKADQLDDMADLYVRTFLFLRYTPEDLEDQDIVEVFNGCVIAIQEDTDVSFLKRYLLFIKDHVKSKRLKIISTVADPEVVEPTNAYKSSNWRLEAELWRDRRPDGYAQFKKFAVELKNVKRRFGINLLRERVRWQTFFDYGDDRYKFCNTLSPYIARMLIEEDPELKALIRCKKTKW
jgi:hypothetical protein